MKREKAPRTQADKDHTKRANQRYGTPEYRRNRKLCLAQANRCQACKNKVATEAHHIIPKWDGGTDELRNLLATCSNCNKKLDAAYRRYKARTHKRPDQAHPGLVKGGG